MQRLHPRRFPATPKPPLQGLLPPPAKSSACILAVFFLLFNVDIENIYIKLK
jgi:hypothetical protein